MKDVLIKQTDPDLKGLNWSTILTHATTVSTFKAAFCTCGWTAQGRLEGDQFVTESDT